MKVSDYIVSFLIEKGIEDVFGYPGGMVTHLLDSLHAQRERITAHVNYHEQGASFAACAYAQTTRKPGVAYATSGPGVTNMITGLCNAYFDSIPVLFITGQVNTYEGKNALPLRQLGFQEMDVETMVSPFVKYATRVSRKEDIRYCLEKAYFLALDGRPGPVLLDIPMDIQRADVAPAALQSFCPPEGGGEACAGTDELAARIVQSLKRAKRPCILAGAGLMASGMGTSFAQFAGQMRIPVLSSMLAVDILPNSPLYYGFIGAYGLRAANFIVSKSDLILSLGSRLDTRQTGVQTNLFATEAELLRVDIDKSESARKVKEAEAFMHCDLKLLLPALVRALPEGGGHEEWLSVCDRIRDTLAGLDALKPNLIIEKLSRLADPQAVVTTDVGQNQVWVAQSFVPRGQRILFSGGHGAMGYALPAAIGAHYGTGKTVFAFTGDGGFQMNIQELQVLSRERLPVKVIVLNNASLGMIRHFQEMYFHSVCVNTVNESGYSVPDLKLISKAYHIPYCRVEGFDVEEAQSLFEADGPALIEVVLPCRTYCSPKLAVGKKLHDQEPPLEKDVRDFLLGL